MNALQAGMQSALAEAERAARAGQVPVGAALELDGYIRYINANSSDQSEYPLEHAELKVLQLAQQELCREEFQRATLYVTLEPCPMCMGAIIHAHVGKLVFGAYNLKWGACGTVADFTSLFPTDRLEVYGGILEQECMAVLKNFFQGVRQD